GAPDAALQVGSSSSSSGTGFGANGGPGGRGRGNGRGSGVVDKAFAFGGPTGAFRADVCFIQPTVRLLTDIATCTPVITFFTSELNVSPRRFNRGFPGLGRRTEWFAIKYQGSFRVRAEDSYNFRLLSDDGARLEIDGHQVLDNDGQHLPSAVSTNVRLAVGQHTFFVFYYQGPPDFVALQLFVKRFAHDEKLFAPEI
ncbi:MAG: PA14 domain-containing protein, partial [Polyangiaceae bacterium]